MNWEYLHPFYKSARRQTPEDEDCSGPDFFPLGDKHVLMFISHTLWTQYYIGRYEDDQFFPEQHGKTNWPGGPYSLRTASSMTAVAALCGLGQTSHVNEKPNWPVLATPE